MRAHADHYTQGKTPHLPCADWALSGVSPVPFAILADGCSASSGSEMGAMVLALAAARRLAREIRLRGALPGYGQFGEAVIHQAARVAADLGLPPAALDATLMAAWLTADTLQVYPTGMDTSSPWDREMSGSRSSPSPMTATPPAI